MTTNTITLIPARDFTELTDLADFTDGAMLELVECELGHACDDLDEFEEALFRLGLAA